jgi:phosphate:Na+ symporter
VEQLQILIGGLTAVILFVYGLEHFSREIERVSGDRLRRFLSRATRIPAVGVLLGAAVTAVIQSSSATSVIAISLVNAGVLSFKNSVGVILGSNVGTTLTAQLVAFKLTAFAPLLVILGFVLSLVRSRWSIFGKSIFYFGFVFFSLNLISSTLEPLRDSPTLVNYLLQPQPIVWTVLAGCVFTALVQSSSVTTGLAIVFAQQGMLGLENAVPLIMGANIGTTATALIAMFNMDAAAKKTALSHLMFNIGGVVVFLPLVLLFGDSLSQYKDRPDIVLANVHLLFNLGACLLFLALIRPFTATIERIVGEGKMDFQRIEMPLDARDAGFPEFRAALESNLLDLLAFLQENYNLVTLSIESNYRSVFEASARRLEYIDFLERDTQGFFSRLVAATVEEEESRELLGLITRYDYLYQVNDSIEDLYNTKVTMDQQYIELKSDVLLLVREISSQTLALFDGIHRALAAGGKPDVHAQASELRATIDAVNRELLRLMADPERRDVGALSHFVTYSRRLRDKLVRFAKIAGRSAED